MLLTRDILHPEFISGSPGSARLDTGDAELNLAGGLALNELHILSFSHWLCNQTFGNRGYQLLSIHRPGMIINLPAVARLNYTPFVHNHNAVAYVTHYR